MGAASRSSVRGVPCRSRDRAAHAMMVRVNTTPAKKGWGSAPFPVSAVAAVTLCKAGFLLFFGLIGLAAQDNVSDPWGGGMIVLGLVFAVLGWLLPRGLNLARLRPGAPCGRLGGHLDRLGVQRAELGRDRADRHAHLRRRRPRVALRAERDEGLLQQRLTRRHSDEIVRALSQDFSFPLESRYLNRAGHRPHHARQRCARRARRDAVCGGEAHLGQADDAASAHRLPQGWRLRPPRRLGRAADHAAGRGSPALRAASRDPQSRVDAAVAQQRLRASQRNGVR